MYYQDGSREESPDPIHGDGNMLFSEKSIRLGKYWKFIFIVTLAIIYVMKYTLFCSNHGFWHRGVVCVTHVLETA